MAASDAHLRTNLRTNLRAILAAAVQDEGAHPVVPGVIVLAGAAGQVVLEEVAGRRQIEPTSLPAERDTVWDLASLTKPLVTVTLAMQAVAEGRLGLDEPIGACPEGTDAATAEAMTVRRVLAHAAGFPANLPLYQALGADEPGSAGFVAAAFERMRREPLAYPPGTRSIYSDLGFMLLGQRVEERLGGRLDELAQRRLGPPFGSAALGFRPIGAAATALSAVAAGDAMATPAATERCPYRQRMVVGEVHDLNTYALGGIAGHAGLFGTAHAVAQVTFALIAAYRGAGSQAGRAPLVERDVVREFWRPAGVPGSNWRLGWDGPAATNSLAGDRLSRDGVGHLAFTGCSLWIDPERETFVLMLSNRVHPVVRDDPRFRALRRAVNDAALDAIGY